MYEDFEDELYENSQLERLEEGWSVQDQLELKRSSSKIDYDRGCNKACGRKTEVVRLVKAGTNGFKLTWKHPIRARRVTKQLVQRAWWFAGFSYDPLITPDEDLCDMLGVYDRDRGQWWWDAVPYIHHLGDLPLYARPPSYDDNGGGDDWN